MLGKGSQDMVYVVGIKQAQAERTVVMFEVVNTHICMYVLH